MGVPRPAQRRIRRDSPVGLRVVRPRCEPRFTQFLLERRQTCVSRCPRALEAGPSTAGKAERAGQYPRLVHVLRAACCGVVTAPVR